MGKCASSAWSSSATGGRYARRLDRPSGQCEVFIGIIGHRSVGHHCAEYRRPDAGPALLRLFQARERAPPGPDRTTIRARAKLADFKQELLRGHTVKNGSPRTRASATGTAQTGSPRGDLIGAVGRDSARGGGDRRRSHQQPPPDRAIEHDWVEGVLIPRCIAAWMDSG